jgi:serine/threonine-protein kinase RsbW
MRRGPPPICRPVPSKVMKIHVEAQARTTIVMAEGRLDFGAAAAFQAQLEKLLAPPGAPAALLVDCSTLEYVSSAGLRAFLLAARAAQRSGSSFALCAPRPAVREVLELSGFSRILTVHADRAAAQACTEPTTGGGERRMSVPGDAAQLPVLTQFLKEFWSSTSLPQEPAVAFELALEEVFMNVATHGSATGGPREVQVSLRREAANLAMTIEDDGPEFNPLTVPAPDLSAPLAERRVGGHGVSLVRQMMDSVTYQRVGGRNRLTMTRHILPD